MEFLRYSLSKVSICLAIKDVAFVGCSLFDNDLVQLFRGEGFSFVM